MFRNIVDKGQSGKLKADLSHLANVYASSYRPSQNYVKTSRILKRLRQNKNIVILKPDKGNGVVFFDRATYDNSILDIISDSSKFRQLKADPTMTRGSKLQRFRVSEKKNVHGAAH